MSWLSEFLDDIEQHTTRPIGTFVTEKAEDIWASDAGKIAIGVVAAPVILPAAGAVIGSAGGLLSGAGGLFGPIISGIGGFFGDVAGGTVDLAGNVLGGAGQLVGGAGQLLGQAAGGIVQGVGGIASALSNDDSDLAKAAQNILPIVQKYIGDSGVASTSGAAQLPGQPGVVYYQQPAGEPGVVYYQQQPAAVAKDMTIVYVAGASLAAILLILFVKKSGGK